MMMRIKNIAIGLVFLATSRSYAQQEFTLYHMNNIFQSSYVNPVGIPEHGISLSLPGISSIYAGAANTGFTVKSAFQGGNTLDLDRIVNDLNKVNYITTGASYDILGFRFKVHNYNISFSIRDILDFRFAYPRDVMQLFVKGNGAFIGKEADWDKFRIHGNFYRDVALGYTYHDPHSKWVYGGRLRFLFGMANISTKTSKTTFTTSDETYDLMLQSRIRVNTSGYKDEYDQSGYSMDGEQAAKDYLLNFKNFGLGLDAGVSYQFSKKLNLAANIKDLGTISWKTDTRNYEIDGTFEFAGLEIKDYSTTDTMLYFVENLPDSLAKLFDVKETKERYSSPLIAQTYFTANYQLFKHTKVSGTLFTEFFHGIQPGLFFGVTQQVGRGFDFTMTYSGFRNSWNNLGFGFTVKPGPVQFYMVSDNILGPLIWANVEGTTLPYNLRSSNIRFGFNVLIGKVREPDLQSSPK